jgi:lysophospholipase L1-like esterase
MTPGEVAGARRLRQLLLTIDLGAPLSVNWTPSDFVDKGHFSAAGSEKFATALAAALGTYCQ